MGQRGAKMRQCGAEIHQCGVQIGQNATKMEPRRAYVTPSEAKRRAEAPQGEPSGETMEPKWAKVPPR